MSRPIKCMAIDDEPLALEVIEKFCQRLGDVELAAFSDPEEGVAAMEAEAPEVLFLDIAMGGTSGLDVAARLPEGVCLIFTTAYMDYALDGFNLDAVDYLHKPFSFDRFRTAFSKAMRRLGRDRSPANIVVKQEYNNVTIALDEIAYIEAMEGYCKIFLVSGSCTVTRMLLKNILSMLPPWFIRIHRSFIVPRTKIKSFTRQELRLSTGQRLPIGRQYASQVADALNACGQRGRNDGAAV